MSQRLFVSCSMLSVRRLPLFSQSTLAVKILFSPFLTDLLLLLLFFFPSSLIRELLLLKEKEHHFLPSVLLDSWLALRQKKNRWTSDFTVHSSGWEGSFLPWKQLSLKDYRRVWREKEKVQKSLFVVYGVRLRISRERHEKNFKCQEEQYSVTDIMKKEGIWIKYSLSYQILFLLLQIEEEVEENQDQEEVQRNFHASSLNVLSITWHLFLMTKTIFVMMTVPFKRMRAPMKSYFKAKYPQRMMMMMFLNLIFQSKAESLHKQSEYSWRTWRHLVNVFIIIKVELHDKPM